MSKFKPIQSNDTITCAEKNANFDTKEIDQTLCA